MWFNKYETQPFVSTLRLQKHLKHAHDTFRPFLQRMWKIFQVNPFSKTLFKFFIKIFSLVFSIKLPPMVSDPILHSIHCTAAKPQQWKQNKSQSFSWIELYSCCCSSLCRQSGKRQIPFQFSFIRRRKNWIWKEVNFWLCSVNKVDSTEANYSFFCFTALAIARKVNRGQLFLFRSHAVFLKLACRGWWESPKV